MKLRTAASVVLGTVLAGPFIIGSAVKQQRWEDEYRIKHPQEKTTLNLNSIKNKIADIDFYPKEKIMVDSVMKTRNMNPKDIQGRVQVLMELREKQN